MLRLPINALVTARTIPGRRMASTASSPIVIGTPAAARKPVGGIRGGLAGFSLGFGLAAAYGYYYLLQDYQRASVSMMRSVEELRRNTEEISSSFARIDRLEKDLVALGSSSSSKTDAESRSAALNRVVEGMHEEVLALKNRLWGVEQDVNTALKAKQAPSKHLV